jgi:hypothetical protein
VEFHQAIQRQGLRSVLESHCGLDRPEDAPLVERILAEYKSLAN